MNTLFKGAALGTAASLLLSNKMKVGAPENNIANVYAMWTHGSEGKMEGVFHDGKDAVSFGDKLFNKVRGALTAGYLRFGKNTRFPGNTISLGGAAAVTMAPTSGGALFRIWDSGTKNNAKNGEFWVHYTIPTPAIANSVRSKVSKILIKCASTDSSFYISDVELWDANLRLFNKGNLKLWGPDKMHSLPFEGNNNTVRYGLCISLKITGANVTADQLFEVSAVGVDMLA
ncbi:hypothetical protein [Maribacter sp. IgM3_T14_3]|uniref:hypothetical protein n=1 Tax=Maribacter sp. IgM3_T14_3 TaxID=3415140 RepID=UPI003C6F8BD0